MQMTQHVLASPGRIWSWKDPVLLMCRSDNCQQLHRYSEGGCCWNKLSFGHEMGWDLEPFAARLQCLHLDTPLLEQQDTKKLDVTRNDRACPVGANSEQKTQKDQNTQLTPLKRLRQKQGPGHAPCTQHLQSQGKTPQPSLQPDPWTHPYPHPM